MDRALVHDAPGTTRDTVDVQMSLRGFPVRLVDTAGIRATPDPVETAGVDRARKEVETASLSLFVMDASAPPDTDDETVARFLEGRPAIAVRNKSDLGDDPASRSFAEKIGSSVGVVSALEGQGMDRLVDILSDHVAREAGQDEGVTMTRARHYDALRRARAAVERSREALTAQAFADMVAADLREALSALGEVTGRSAGDDILDRIFSTFCIGK